MSLLQYTSKEMFSSTELVRKSKNIFDKLNKKEIEKAIILRDGKPGIILLDFNEYERIISEYINLKDKNKNHSLTEKVETKKEEIIGFNYDMYFSIVNRLFSVSCYLSTF